MKPAASLDDFLARPVGRYVVGGHYLAWCANPTLCGSTLWGTVEEADLPALFRLWDLFRHIPSPRFSAVTDARYFEQFTPDLLAAVLGYLRARVDDFGERLDKHAFLVATNTAGAAMIGTYAAAGMSHDWRIFDSSEACFAWLDPAAGPPIGRDLDRLIADARAQDPLLGALHRYLAATKDEPSLERFAATVGRSTRSLQRELTERGTNFRQELTAFRRGKPSRDDS